MIPLPTQAQRGGNKASMTASAHSVVAAFGGNIKKDYALVPFFDFLICNIRNQCISIYQTDGPYVPAQLANKLKGPL